MTSKIIKSNHHPSTTMQGFRSVPVALWRLLKSRRMMQEVTDTPLKGVFLCGGPFLWQEGWWQSWGGCGGARWPRGSKAEVPYGPHFPRRRTVSSTSRRSGSSCCPWRGRGWIHPMGTSHGAGFLTSPAWRSPWESQCGLDAVGMCCSSEEELSPSRAVKESGEAEGLGNWLLSCCRNQEPSVLQKIKELWL